MTGATIPPTTTKPFWKSKTVLVQALALLCMFIPAVAAWVAANPVEFVAVLGAVNTIVRFATSGKVTIFDDDSSGGMGVPADGESKISAGLGTGARMDHKQRTQAWPWLVVSGCAALLATSCTPAQLEAFRATPITIGIEGEHGSYAYSSKSGLSVSARLPRVREEKSGPVETQDARLEGPINPHRPYRPRRLVLP